MDAGGGVRLQTASDIAVQLGVAGAVDLTHAARADLGGDRVGAERGALVSGAWVVRGHSTSTLVDGSKVCTELPMRGGCKGSQPVRRVGSGRRVRGSTWVRVGSVEIRLVSDGGGVPLRLFTRAPGPRTSRR